MRVRRLPLLLPGILAAGLIASGCAAQPGGAAAANNGTTAAAEGAGPGAEVEFNDPFEDLNRGIFAFNQTVDHAVLIPVAKAYRTVLPTPVRQSVRNFLQNLDEPVIFANDVLQGQGRLAAHSLGRIFINTTAGLGGLIDVAGQAGIPYHSNDFGITLATWGFAAGPYLVIPVLGPSNPRDLIGHLGDSYADPGDYVATQHHLWVAVLARHVTAGIDERSRNIENLAEIEKTALDYYATIRSLYRQRRAAQIRHERSTLPNPTPVHGSDASPLPAISYSLAHPPRFREASTQ